MADTPKLGQSASMENSGSELTLPPMNQTTAMTVAESMDANAPAEHDFFQKNAPSVGRNRPAELMVNVMSRMFMMSCVNQPKIAPSTPTNRDAPKPTRSSVLSDALGLM